MTISKELLENYKLISINICIYNKDIMTTFCRQNNNEWTFKLSENLDKKINTIILKFNFENYITQATVEVLEIGEDYIITKKIINSEDEKLNNFIQKLNEIENNNEKYGRRKEERIDIGDKNYRLFGLEKINQQLIVQSEKIITNCVLADVSFHGIKIITPYNQVIPKLNNFTLFISFNNPIENVYIEVHKVYINLNKINEHTYASISCQILEPVNYVWKERIIKLIEKIEK